MNIKKHFFLYSILCLTILSFSASYYRFMVIDEYLVSYEGYCDPEYNSCFVECEDDECTSEYYFSVIERGANTVKNLCGENILECEEAEYCQDDEINCSITFCDPVIDGEGSCVYTPKNKNL